MRNRLFVRAATFACAAFLAAGSGSVGLGGAAQAAKFATSEAPFYRVGALDRKLSRACQRGEFGQIKRHAYNIAFVGPTGRALTGIATTYWNLYDPLGLAEPDMTYHFYNQGYSDCRVFKARFPNR
jgi:hypothetical protein